MGHPIMVIRLLQYTYKDADTMVKDMKRWTLSGEYGHMSMSSTSASPRWLDDLHDLNDLVAEISGATRLLEADVHVPNHDMLDLLDRCRKAINRFATGTDDTDIPEEPGVAP